MQKLYISVVLLTATATLANAQTVRPMMPLDNERANVLRTTKDALQSAQGYRFDRTTRKWMPEVAGTIGSGGATQTPVRR